ncbi:hypothetical protein U8C44_34725 [Sinorhizobium meliloti]|nr:hypothetical protein U8C44_34725 [Sinorhizobium meliloti]
MATVFMMDFGKMEPDFGENHVDLDLNPFKSKVILQKFPEKPQKRTKTPKFLHAWSARAAVDRP